MTGRFRAWRAPLSVDGAAASDRSAGTPRAASGLGLERVAEALRAAGAAHEGEGDGDRCQRRADRDRGSATVLSLAVVAALCVVFGMVLALGQAAVVRHRAATGADLAALAAAEYWAQGPGAACARGREAAAAHGVRLVRCAVAGEISDVTAASGWGPFEAEVRARAGPPTAAAPGPGGLP